MHKKVSVAVFGGGCFWCTEAVFKMLKGVASVLPGYAGGIKEHPTYAEVSSGASGHAEVTRIEYDTEQISFSDLLTVFFATHDPTTLNRQGNDTGTQYRSIIFYTTDGQRDEATRFIEELNVSYPVGQPVVTEVQPLEKFYEAENYHRDYYVRNRENPYCRIVINPKLQKVREKFTKLLRATEDQ